MLFHFLIGGYHLHHVHMSSNMITPLTPCSSQDHHHLSKCVLPHDGPPNEHVHCSMSDHACSSGGTEEVSSNDGTHALMGQEHVTLQRLQTQSTILTNGVSHIPKVNTPSSNRQQAAVVKSVTTCRSSSKRLRQNKNARARKKAQK